MVDGRVRLMQQGAGTSSGDVSDRVGTAIGDFWHRRFAAVLAKQSQHRVGIRRVVQAEVLPRISVGHVRRPAPESIDATAVRELVELLLRCDNEANAIRHVEGALARGLSVEHIYLRLLQPAARSLGDLWCDDICSFVDVTLAMGVLQALLRRLAPGLHRHGRPANGQRSILLTTLPGDQHTFGVNMAAEFFRRSGWDVCTTPWDDGDGWADAVRRGGCSVVGFSAGAQGRLHELAAAISGLRRTFKGAVGVLVGGPVFVSNPEQAIRVGADAVGLDARQAVAQAEALAGRDERR